ncbi:Long-chain-fatty-acid--CoA ligase [Paraburkholderia aspalathi]|uniref:ATP-dependent acyl-CoA ligase n=1 Tax=Paraburkholderia aspalathi TaxID=1324617 RepID=UPI00190D6EF7|nr:ATP-dependent acyl-CoA ligase [Paraburkholderia aspalathi]MBK3843551.1 ATP-dependent acyl-CoA ligase [Paraburkholderia aspalathi]CAE6855795.1 Long-chain-fatty-acid--CoA ligase [Paraburkholderia aspalathi]
MKTLKQTSKLGFSDGGPGFNVSTSQRTLPALLTARASATGDTPLFSDRTTRWSGTDALDVASRRAGALKAAGIGPGDRVALMCSNRAEFLEIVLGCGWLGAVVVPINIASRGMQLQHMLANSGARLLVVESSLAGSIAALELSALALESVWLIHDGKPAAALPFACDTMPPLSDAVAASSIGPGDALAILYTSGTSGLSKGVVCPHAQFYWWGRTVALHLGITRADTLYTVLPLFHTNALNSFFQALLTGASLVVDARFSASRFFSSLVETGATVTYLLGAMVPILLSKPASDAERAHSVRIALAPGVPEQFHADFTDRCGIPLLDGFGSTETNCVLGRGLTDQRPGWMGRLAEDFEALVADENDESVPDGQPGELLLRATQPFAFATGYFGAPEKTVEAWRNLWFHTGDRVIRDADGYYKFVDRLKDAIRRRGENISSYEVEQTLLSHPDIETAAVYAVRSELAEDEVMAAVVLRGGSTLTHGALVAYCEPRLAYFAIPRFIEFMDDLPKTENGKIQKYRLRERGTGSDTWDREAAGYQLKRA